MARTFSSISISNNSGPAAPALSLGYTNDGEPGSATARVRDAAAIAAIADLNACAPFMAILNALVDTVEAEATNPASRAELVASVAAAEQSKLTALAAERAALVRLQTAERAITTALAAEQASIARKLATEQEIQAAQIVLSDTNASVERASATARDVGVLDLGGVAPVRSLGGASPAVSASPFIGRRPRRA